MKGIKIVVLVLMCLTLIFLVQAGFSQAVKNQPNIIPPQGAKFVKLIKGCSVPYLNTKKLYAAGGQVYLVPPEVNEEQLYAVGGQQYLISLSPEGGKEQSPADTKGREYRISREVEVKEKGKRGARFDIQSFAGVGFITKADIFIINDSVVKIIIIDMEQ